MTDKNVDRMELSFGDFDGVFTTFGFFFFIINPT